MTTAGDIMHRGAQWIPAHETLDRAAQLMRELNVGALPISDENERLCGILTDRDIVVGCVAMGHDPAKVTAGDMAQGTPRWIESDADVDDVLTEMRTHQIHAAARHRRKAPRRHDQRGRPGPASDGRTDRRVRRERLRPVRLRLTPPPATGGTGGRHSQPLRRNARYSTRHATDITPTTMP